MLGKSEQAQCGMCGCVDRSIYFDVDHKIPQCVGGPNELWNLWPLCLKHHRLKCLAEIEWVRNLQNNEVRCFSCNSVCSAYFRENHLWCTKCLVLPFDERTRNLCTIIQNFNI